MLNLKTITVFLQERTQEEQIPDFAGAYNGLQFATQEPIRGIAATVDASLPALKSAVQAGANLVIAHHGLFWNTPCPIVGHLFEKYRFLIENGCAVYSSHLPLDTHAEIGNNALIAKLLEMEIIGRFVPYQNIQIGVRVKPLENRADLKSRLLKHFPNMKAFEFGPEIPKNIGISSGSGASVMNSLHKEDVDTFITGELRQSHFAQAQEEGLNIYLCGHYATEVFGVQALAKEAADKFNLPYTFIPSDCPL